MIVLFTAENACSAYRTSGHHINHRQNPCQHIRPMRYFPGLKDTGFPGCEKIALSKGRPSGHLFPTGPSPLDIFLAILNHPHTIP